MGLVIDLPAEIDRDRPADLLLPPGSTADRSMGLVIAASRQELPHV